MAASVFEEIKGRIDCLSLVEDLGFSVNGSRKILCPNPSHKDEEASCQVNSDYLYCFGCQKSWTAIDLVIEVKNWDLITAAKWLAERAGIPWPEKSEEGQQEYEKQLNRHNELEKRLNYWAKNLRPEDIEYLKKRGLDEGFIKQNRIGFCSQKMPQDLTSAKELGLLTKTKRGSDFYFPYDRLIIPLYQYGKVAQIAFHKPGDQAKYLYPAGWSKPLIKSFKRHESPFLVEGVFDYLSLLQAGLPVMTALGVAVSKAQREDLARIDTFYIAFDGDEAGRRGALELAREFYPAARVINLPAGKDVNDLFQELGPEGFKAFMLEAGKDAKNYLNILLDKLEKDPGDEATRTEALKLIARIKSGIDRDLQVEELSRILKPLGITKTSVRQEVSRLQKVLAAQGKAQAKDSEGEEQEIEYIAEFPGLVDICENSKTGEPCFLVASEQGEGTELKELASYTDVGDQVFYVPPRDQMPWLLADAEAVKEHFKSDNDRTLYDDLVKHFQGVSELPSENHYKLLAWWTLHSYVFEKGEYSPYLWFYAVPERGKSRTGKAMIYLAWRGVHVESLRDAYIVRMAHNFGASLFFDCMDLWRKAEKQGTEDVLLLRFEKGARVPRVLYPERGPFKDTVYFKMFGPSLIATNKEVNQILSTRAVQINMPSSRRRFDKDIRPQDALELKARLTAFRARHMFSSLPDAKKPTNGRLGDIMRPLLQIVKLVCPEEEESFKGLLSEIQASRMLEKSGGWEAKIIGSIVGLVDQVESGLPPLLPQKTILESYNEDVRENYQLSSQGLGHRLKALGFESKKMGDGRMGLVWDEKLLENLCEEYDLPQALETLRKLRNAQKGHSSRDVSAGDLPEITETALKASRKTPENETQSELGFKANSGDSGDYGDFSGYGGEPCATCLSDEDEDPW